MAKEIDITKDLYLCSPLLNTKCTKENCYINNGCCCHTVDKEYSQEYLIEENKKLNREIHYLKSELYFSLGAFLKKINFADPKAYKKVAKKKYEKLAKERAKEISDYIMKLHVNGNGETPKGLLSELGSDFND